MQKAKAQAANAAHIDPVKPTQTAPGPVRLKVRATPKLTPKTVSKARWRKVERVRTVEQGVFLHFTEGAPVLLYEQDPLGAALHDAPNRKQLRFMVELHRFAEALVPGDFSFGGGLGDEAKARMEHLAEILENHSWLRHDVERYIDYFRADQVLVELDFLDGMYDRFIAFVRDMMMLNTDNMTCNTYLLDSGGPWTTCSNEDGSIVVTSNEWTEEEHWWEEDENGELQYNENKSKKAKRTWSDVWDDVIDWAGGCLPGGFTAVVDAQLTPDQFVQQMNTNVAAFNLPSGTTFEIRNVTYLQRLV